MDSDEIRYLLGKCIHLKNYFYGVFVAYNFPKLTKEGFIIINASPAQYEGSHWMVYLDDPPLGMFIWLTRLEPRYKTTKYCIPV